MFLKPEWKLLRIDPGSVSGFVEIKKLEIDGKDMTSNLQVADGIRSGSYVCFTQNDPNMMLAELPWKMQESWKLSYGSGQWIKFPWRRPPSGYGSWRFRVRP